MKEISKAVAHQLHDEYGVPFKDGGICHSYSRNGRKYYLTESKNNLDKLKKLTAKKQK